MGKFMKFLGFESEDDYFDEIDENTNSKESSHHILSNISENKIDNGKVSLVICKIQQFDEVTIISDKVMEGKIVIINTNSVCDGKHQRILDFISGLSYSTNSEFIKINQGVFAVIPPNITLDKNSLSDSLLKLSC